MNLRRTYNLYFILGATVAALGIFLLFLSTTLRYMPSNQNNSYVLNAVPAMDRINAYPNSQNDLATLLNTTVTSESYRIAFNGAESSVGDHLNSHEQQESMTILPLVNESTIYSGTILIRQTNQLIYRYIIFIIRLIIWKT